MGGTVKAQGLFLGAVLNTILLAACGGGNSGGGGGAPGSIVALQAVMTSAREGAVAANIGGTNTTLVAGGWDGNSILSSAEIFQPNATSVNGLPTFTALPNPMVTPRYNAVAVGLLVPSGPILIAGGFNGFLGACPTSACQPHVLSSAELFNPTSQGFTALANPMTTPRQGAVAALLSDGTVLIAGGTDGNHILSSAEIYDPSAQTFTALPSSMVTPRLGAIAFGNAGEVVIAGGTDGNVTLSSAEIYDPARKVFTALPNKMSTPRMGAAASSFGVSTLIAGGSNGGQILASVEVFDATSQTFALQPYQLNTGRTGGSATTVAGWVPIPALSSAAVPTVPLFPTERFSVVIFGGHGNDGVLNSVEVFESSFGPGPCTTPPCPE